MKVVSFFLFRYRSGSVQNHDHEVLGAEWIRLSEAPAKLAYKEKQRNRLKGLKLNVTKVKSIKRLLAKPGKRTMKQIAEQFDISEMQLYRIKSGENWSHVNAD